MRTFLKSLIQDNRGASAVEYGLIAGFIVLALMVGLSGVAGKTVTMWNEISSKSADAISGQ